MAFDTRGQSLSLVIRTQGHGDWRICSIIGPKLCWTVLATHSSSHVLVIGLQENSIMKPINVFKWPCSIYSTLIAPHLFCKNKCWAISSKKKRGRIIVTRSPQAMMGSMGPDPPGYDGKYGVPLGYINRGRNHPVEMIFSEGWIT